MLSWVYGLFYPDRPIIVPDVTKMYKVLSLLAKSNYDRYPFPHLFTTIR